MSVNLDIEEIIKNSIYSAQNTNTWNEYKMNILKNLNAIDLVNKIENYKPCEKYLYVSKARLIDIIYKNIILNDKLFIELFRNGYYPRQEYNFTGNDIWNLVDECMKIMVIKQHYK
jgi:hypothetical protein